LAVASRDYHPVANRVASDVALRDYHLVANPVLTMLTIGLPTKKTCFYGGVIGVSGRRPNLCGGVWLANVAGLLRRHSGRRAGLQWRCWRIAGLLSSNG
jgi:hypothetical protein